MNLNIKKTHGEALQPAGQSHAFTLMEVMIAIGVFSVGVFAILSLIASVMHEARLLDKPMVDAGVVASEIGQTNALVEVHGAYGSLSDFLGDNYKDYSYMYDINEVQSNRLSQLDVKVYNDRAPGKPVISQMSVLLFRPQSPAGPLDGGMAGH